MLLGFPARCPNSYTDGKRQDVSKDVHGRSWTDLWGAKLQRGSTPRGHGDGVQHRGLGGPAGFQRRNRPVWAARNHRRRPLARRRRDKPTGRCSARPPAGYPCLSDQVGLAAGPSPVKRGRANGCATERAQARLSSLISGLIHPRPTQSIRVGRKSLNRREDRTDPPQTMILKPERRTVEVVQAR
jgi:hypothetical protein